jgi:hypothetical protein
MLTARSSKARGVFAAGGGYLEKRVCLSVVTTVVVEVGVGALEVIIIDETALVLITNVEVVVLDAMFVATSVPVVEVITRGTTLRGN